MDRIELLRIFARVVDCASFTRAANTLRLPRSSVSTAIQELERTVGARLLHRTTRHVAPTQDGTAFYERCVRLIGDYEDAVGLFQQAAAAPRGKLKVDVPGRFGRLVIAPALPTFFARFPDIEIELGVTDRAVDVIQDGIDCAIRVGAPEDSGLIARKLGELPLVNCASPAYLAAYGTPRTAADLDAHIAVNYASPTSGRLAPWAWTEGGQARSRTMAGKVTVNSAEAYIACCLAGLGLIQVPAYDVRDYLGSGGLVEVMPGERAAPMPLTLLYPHRRHLSRRLQAFVDWVVTLLESSVLQASPGGGRRTPGGATP